VQRLVELSKFIRLLGLRLQDIGLRMLCRQGIRQR
jgi:hypothetical protein